MIAIRTNKEVLFTDGIGIVTISIDMPIIRPNENRYELRLVHSCIKETTIDGELIATKVGHDIVRFRSYTYEKLQSLVNSIDIDISKENIVMDIDELFKLGLLSITKQECIDGVSGIPGKGLYYSEAQDWEIVR